MATVTKKQVVDRVAEKIHVKQVLVRRVVQAFLDEIIEELDQGSRLEFRDFGIFECRYRAARIAQNPRTQGRVTVPDKRKVRFKAGRLMLQRLANPQASTDGHPDARNTPAGPLVGSPAAQKPPANVPGLSSETP